MNRKIKLLLVIVFNFSMVFYSSAQQIPKWKISRLENYIRESKKPVVINFWASFCKPCIQKSYTFRSW